MTLNNPAIYDSVLAGIAGCNGAWITSSNGANYIEQYNAAVAIATEVDAAIPPILLGVTLSQRQLVEGIAKSVMGGRSPKDTLASSYQQLSNAIAALFTQFNTGLQNQDRGASSLPIRPALSGVVNENDAVRLAGPNLIAAASTLTVTTATSVIGVYQGGAVIPFECNPIVNFTEQPVVGRPCYLSATSGKFTQNVATVGSLEIPFDLLILNDETTGGVFKAQVTLNGSVAVSPGRKQGVIQRAIARTAMNPSALRTIYLDFNADEVENIIASAAYRNPKMGVVVPNPGNFALSTRRSCIQSDNGFEGFGLIDVLSGGNGKCLSNQNWYYYVTAQMSNPLDALVVEIFMDFNNAAFTEDCGIVMYNGFHTANFAAFKSTNGNGAIYNSCPVPVTGGTFIDFAPTNTDMNTFEIWSISDGNVYFAFNGGAAVSFNMPTSGSQGNANIFISSTNTFIDEVAFVTT